LAWWATSYKVNLPSNALKVLSLLAEKRGNLVRTYIEPFWPDEFGPPVTMAIFIDEVVPQRLESVRTLFDGK
jgi:DNA-binding winged helix-turn-helix (wHTH) protein